MKVCNKLYTNCPDACSILPVDEYNKVESGPLDGFFFVEFECINCMPYKSSVAFQARVLNKNIIIQINKNQPFLVKPHKWSFVQSPVISGTLARCWGQLFATSTQKLKNV